MVWEESFTDTMDQQKDKYCRWVLDQMESDLSLEAKIIKLRLQYFGHRVVPRLTVIISSRKIAVKRKHRKAKIKSPLKSIENLSMCSSGLKT